MAQGHTEKGHFLYTCAFDITKLSVMVAEPDPTPSEKRPPLLYKEQIIDKIDENPEIQTTLETYESMTTLKQNLDIPVSELMEQLIEVTRDHLPEQNSTVYSGANQLTHQFHKM